MRQIAHRVRCSIIAFSATRHIITNITFWFECYRCTCHKPPVSLSPCLSPCRSLGHCQLPSIRVRTMQTHTHTHMRAGKCRCVPRRTGNAKRSYSDKRGSGRVPEQMNGRQIGRRLQNHIPRPHEMHSLGVCARALHMCNGANKC